MSSVVPSKSKSKSKSNGQKPSATDNVSARKSSPGKSSNRLPSPEDEQRSSRRPPPRRPVGSENDNTQEPVVYYKRPDICCCDPQDALIWMACIDIIIAFICVIIFLSALIPKSPSSTAPRSRVIVGGHHPHPRPHLVVVSHPRPFYVRRVYRRYRFKREAENMTMPMNVTTTPGMDDSMEEEANNLFETLGIVAAILMAVFSITLLCGALMRKYQLTWISLLLGWIIFILSVVFYCLYIFGNGDEGNSLVSLILILIAIGYRIYETIVVYYFIKEPPPPRRIVRYVDNDEVIIGSSPGAVYQPVVGYDPYYGGYEYGYGGGLGLGLALGHHHHDVFDDFHYHDHHDFHDGFGYDDHYDYE